MIGPDVAFVAFFVFFLMIRRPPRSTLDGTLFPYTTLFRSVEVRHGEGAHDLPHPIGSIVEAEDPVAVFDQRRAFDHARLYEFVGCPRFVRLLDRCNGIRYGDADAFHHRIVGEPSAIPTLVAIHREVSAGDGGYNGGRAPGAGSRG